MQIKIQISALAAGRSLRENTPKKATDRSEESSEMRVPLKLFSFSFGIFFLTFAQGQEITCKLKETKYGMERIEPEAKTFFRVGETVHITCSERYRIFFTKETIKTFKCLDDGRWDHTPVCEEITCEVPRDRRLSYASYYFYGNMRLNERRTYKCLSDYRQMASEATCTKDGWKPDPLCGADIMCEAPNIPNAQFEERTRTHYEVNSRIVYHCPTEPQQRIEITCNSQGRWTNIQPCRPTEITCELKETKFGIERIEPEAKTFFRVGETVHITCSERYRIFFAKETIKTFKCLYNGQWDNTPVCEEISCEVPRDRRLYYASYYFYGNVRLNERRTYKCVSDYRQMASEATCTKDGWKPDPLCDDIMCEAPNIPNAQFEERTRTRYEVYSRIVYHCPTEPQQRIEIICDYQGRWTNIQPCTEKKESCTTPIIRNGKIHRDSSENEMIYYSCNLGYKPYFGNWWGAAMCANGTWINEPRCIRVDECGALPSILHGQLNIEQSVVEIKCDPGFKSSHTVIICINGTWQTPTCELDEQSCVSPPKVDNALIISKPQTWYSSGSYVNYICLTNFTMSGNSAVECRNAKWEKAPTCEAFCSKPFRIVNNAILIDIIQGERKYSHGDTAHYKCLEDYESYGQTIAKCDARTWIYPECIKKAQCTKPTINLQFVTLLDEKNTFNNFDVLRYTCNKPYDKIPNGTLICKAGKWNSTFDCTSSICPPPPLIEDGDFNIERKTGEVITLVSYSCKSYFVLDKPNRYCRCLNGIWETPPKCLKPCKITPDIYKEYNIKPIPHDYISHSAREVRLDCNYGWNVGGFSRQSYSKALCNDGELRIEKKCNEKEWLK